MDPPMPDRLPPSVMARMRYFRRTERVLEALSRHPDKPLSLQEASAVAGMEASAFSRFFHKEIGMTYSEFQRQFHISRAMKLMLHKHMTIKEVASAAGYGSVTTFERQFKKETGWTPSEYQAAVKRRAGKWS